MRLAATSLLAAVVTLTGVAPARASWSAPSAFSAVRPGLSEVAVNGAGETAVAWTSGAPVVVSVSLRARTGRRVTRAVWTSTRKRPRLAGLAVALDEGGAVVVAWIADGVLRSSHGAVTGRWSPAQIIARDAWGPRLAISRDRTQLLAWTSMAGSGATGVAWRTPGHGFTPPAVLRRPAPQLTGYAPQSRTGVAFDAGGAAYLWGTCDGAIRIARRGSRRWGAPVTVSAGRALGFSLSVARAGTGIASWVDSSCTGDISAGPAPGPARARTLRSGAFGAPVTLAQETEGTTTAVAIAGDGSLVGFGSSLVEISAGGVPGVTTPYSNAVAPLADGGGDVMTFAPLAGYLVLPRGGGSPAPFDLPHPVGWRGAAAAAGARAFAVVWDPDLVVDPVTNRIAGPTTRLSVAVWLP